MFSHGALYVACSRVGHPDQLKFSLPNPEVHHTLNIVWREVFGVLEPKLDYGLERHERFEIKGRLYDRVSTGKQEHASFFDACAQHIKLERPGFRMTGSDLRSMVAKRFRTDPELAEQLYEGQSPGDLFTDLDHRPTFVEKWGWKKYGEYLRKSKSYPGGFEITMLNEILCNSDDRLLAIQYLINEL